MLRLAIVGSRTFNDYDKLIDCIGGFSKKITEVISGGASGADSLGERFADYCSIPKKVFKPEWSVYGKRAGFLRNQKIVNNCDMVLAFWDGKSKGTADTIEKAKTAKKPTLIVYI